MKVNDLTPYPIGPIPVTPKVGSLFQDPVFGTTILRVTDETNSSAAGCVSEYGAIWDMFNCDSSWFYFMDLNGSIRMLGQLDVEKKKFIGKQNITKNIVAQYWSRTDPNIFYAIENWEAAKIWEYNISAKAWRLIIDLTNLVPITKTPNTAWVGSRGMSWDNNRFHLDFGSVIGVGIYDVKLGALFGPVPLTKAQITLPGCTAYAWDKTTMDMTGTYVVTTQTTGTLNGQTSNSAELLYNIITNQGLALMFGYDPAGFYPEVHQDFSGGGLVAAVAGLPPPGPNDGFYPIIIGPVDTSNLSTYLTSRRRIGPHVPWGIDSHSSFRDASLNWLTFTYDGMQDINDKEVQPFQSQEIFQINVNSPPDGSLNQRICQAYSNPASANQPYWGIPFASQSQDNRVVGFHSTYGNKRLDIYIAFLEEAAPLSFTQDETRKLKNFANTLK
jgi:hypothetical protein